MVLRLDEIWMTTHFSGWKAICHCFSQSSSAARSCYRSSRTLGFLKRNLRGCKTSTRARAYEAIVRPNLKYAASIWDPYNTGQINQEADLNSPNLEGFPSKLGYHLSDTSWLSVCVILGGKSCRSFLYLF
jgi:hypothetical protein